MAAQIWKCKSKYQCKSNIFISTESNQTVLCIDGFGKRFQNPGRGIRRKNENINVNIKRFWSSLQISEEIRFKILPFKSRKLKTEDLAFNQKNMSTKC